MFHNILQQDDKLMGMMIYSVMALYVVWMASSFFSTPPSLQQASPGPYEKYGYMDIPDPAADSSEEAHDYNDLENDRVYLTTNRQAE